MAELRNWYLAMAEGKLNAHGDIYYSEKIEDGKSIMTSEIREITYLADRLQVHTKHSVYDLPYGCHRLMDAADTNSIPVEYLQGKQESLDLTRWMEDAVEERREREKNAMLARIPAGVSQAVVIRFSSESTFYYLAMVIKNGKSISYTDSYTVRLGKYTDSVLIDGTVSGTKYAYYPQYASMEFYTWDDTLGPVFLENTGRESLSIVKDEKTYILHAGECIRIG